MLLFIESQGAWGVCVFEQIRNFRQKSDKHHLRYCTLLSLSKF